MVESNVVQGYIGITDRRSSGNVVQHVSPDVTNIVLQRSSTVRIPGSPDRVVRYERQGDDLILHMQDGTVVRYQRFFLIDAEGYHSELVFDDGTRLTHIHFSSVPGDTAALSAGETVTLIPQYDVLTDISSLLLHSTSTSGLSAGAIGGMLGALALGGGVIAAASSSSNDDNRPSTPPPSLTVNPLSGDNILNREEFSQSQVLNGSTRDVAPGSVVTIVFNGLTYTTLVAQDGTWTITLPANVFAGLEDGTYPIQVSVTDAQGSTHQQTVALEIDTLPPFLTENMLTGDNYLNAADQAQGQTLSGRGEAGLTVTVTLNGKTYTTTVDNEEKWQLPLSSADLQALSEGANTMTIVTVDKAGNSTSITRELIVDTTPPTLRVQKFTGDDFLTADELKSTQTLSGITSPNEAGQSVTITLNGKTYSGTVNSDGSWSIPLSATDLQALTDGTYPLVASITDKAGNTTTLPAQSITVNRAVEAININTVSGDDRLNAVEAAQPLLLSGTTANVAEGQTVTITFNGHVYTTLTTSNGSWSFNVPSSDLVFSSDNSYDVSASVAGLSGNTVTTTHPITVVVNTLPVATLEPPFNDGVLNGIEAGQEQTLKGSTGVTGPGQSVTVSIGGQVYTGTVDNSGNWQVQIPGSGLQNLPSGSDSTVTVEVSDAAGNKNILTKPVPVDTTPPTLTLSPVGQDDILNNSELSVNQVINGTASVSEAGLTVTVTLNGKNYPAIVDPSGNWQITLPTGDLILLTNGTHTLTATLSDEAGNTSTLTHTFTVDNGVASLPTITINPFAGDDIVNGAESKVSHSLSGTTTHVEAGRTVTLTLHGKTYFAVVESGGTWHVTVPSADMALLPNGPLNITANVSNQSGYSTSASKAIEVDAAGNAIAINIIASDDLINKAEATQPLAINGNTANVPAGQTVTITLNGKSYTTQVQADGAWTLQIPSADLQALSDGNATVTATVSDSQGQTASDQHNVGVHIHAVPAPTIDTPFGNGSLNLNETHSDQTVSGKTGISGNGQTVVVTLGGKTYNATVDTNGNWHAMLPAADLQQLPEGNTTLKVTATDIAGNHGTGSVSSLVDITPPTLTLGTLATDDIINIQEAQSTQTLNGTASVSEAGRTVTVALGGQFYTGKVGNDGNWSVDLPSHALASLPNGVYSLVASLSDATGNVTQVTKTITLDANSAMQPTVTVNAFVSEDNTISAADTKVSQILSGSTTNVEEGQTVTIQLHTKVYYATVNGEGKWWVSVPAEHMADLPEGQIAISTTVSDMAGNEGSGSSWSDVDISNDSISISIIAMDNLLNRVEAAQPLTVSGTTVNVTTGQTVTVTLNGKTYTTTTSADGSWSLSIPSADLLQLQDGTAVINASVANPNDDPVTAQRNLDVHINNLPQPSLETPFGDNILNAAEAATGQTVIGKTGVSGSGQNVVITLNGKTYQATVDAQGNWRADLPAADLQVLSAGPQPLRVTATDVAGNSSEVSSTVTVDRVPPTLTLKPITLDGIINHAESQSDQAISGNASLTEAGRIVLVTFNGKQYSATVQADGSWNVTVQSADLQAMADGTYTYSATVSDTAGNSTTASGQVTLDANIANLPVLTVNAVTGNNIIDGAEIKAAQILSGSSLNLEAGQTVTVILNGKTYLTTVDNQGHWQVNVPATDLAQLAQGQHALEVSAQDKSGNPVEATHTFEVNTALSGIAIDPVTGDDKLNQSEVAQNITVTGSSQNVAAGTTVTLSLHGKTYTGTTTADGTWSVLLPAADLQQLVDGATTMTFSTVDSAGNTLSGSHAIGVFIHTLPNATLAPVFGDSVLNAAEAGSTQTLSGSTGITTPGQTVTVTLGGTEHTATVTPTGSWSVTLPPSALQALPDGSTPVSIVVKDAAGNQSTLTQTVTVDRTPPTLTLGNLATDNILNQSEVLTAQTLTGSAPTAEAGRTVTVTFNGKSYSGTVGSDGQWSIALSAADLGALSDGTYTLSATLSDAAGNSSTVTRAITVDASAQHAPRITLGNVAFDNIIDGAEIQSSQTISGTTLNVEAGQTVTLTFNGKPYSAIVQSNGTWSTTIPLQDMSQLVNGTQTLSASVSDTSDNTASASQPITINTNTSGLAIAAITGDNRLNAQEATDGITISGSSSNIAAGASITVLLNGKAYSAIVQANGSWQTATIPGSDLTILGDGTLTVSAIATDQVGKTVTNSQTLQVSINQLPQATLDAPFGNGYLNQNEAQAGQTLTGTTGISGAGQTVSVTIGAQTFTGTVNSNGHWQLPLPSNVLTQLSDGVTAISVTVTDAAGNTSTANGSVNIDLTPPVLTISAISGDDIINIADSLQPLVISGTSPVNDSGQTVVVRITFNGQIYQGTALSDGSWQITVPAGDLAGSANGLTTVVATLVDAAGNTGSATRDVTLDTDFTQAPTVTIGTLSDDDYLNAQEATQALTLSGTTTHVEQGQIVTLTLNGKPYSATVQANGSWSVQVPALDVSELPDGKLTVSANVSDKGGNPATNSHTLNVIAQPADLPTIAISTVSGDDVVNAQDAGSPMTISGSTAHVTPGRSVSVLLNGKTYIATVGSDDTWSTTVPANDVQALPQGQQSITANVSDIAQNPASTSHSITVDTTPPLLEIDALVMPGDIGLATALAGVPISGKGEAGLYVTLTVGNSVYTAVTNSNGVWQTTLSASDLLALGDGTATLTAKTTDSAGNSSSDTLDITLKTQALPTLTVNPLFTDNQLNLAELQAGGTLSGSYTNLPAGTQLTLTIGSYTTTSTTLAGGLWSATIPPNALSGLNDGNVQVSISAADSAGNPASASGTLDIVTHTTFNVTLNTPFIDGKLNAAEAGVDQVLSGSTGVNGVGQQVTVTIDGKPYVATVTETGLWSVTLPAADLQGLNDGAHTLIVTAQDKAGNPSTPINAGFNSIVEGVPSAGITEPLFGDGFLSASEVQNGVTLNGQTGLASDSGQTVSVSINGTVYNATVNANGSWTLPLSSTVLSTLSDGTVNVIVTVTDSVGNSSTATGSAEALFHTLPSVTVVLPFGDGYLNLEESNNPQTLSGKTGISGSGQTVTVTLDAGTANQQVFTGVQVDGLGGWSLPLTATQLAAFTEGGHTLLVTVTDKAGNSSNASTTVTASLTLPEPNITEPLFGSDNILNIAEAKDPITLSGTTNSTGSAQNISVEIDLNGVIYQTVVTGNTWSVTLPANALSSLAESDDHKLIVTATDAAGNTASDTVTFENDFHAPAVTLDTPFGDGYLNATEIAALSGNAGDATIVMVTIGSNSPIQATLTNGQWSLNAAQLSGLSDGTQTLTVTATDAAGNSASVNSQVNIVVNTRPTLTVSSFVGADGLDFEESLTAQTLSGTSTGLEVGQKVTVTFGINQYDAFVGAGGVWSVSIPSSVLQQFTAPLTTLAITAQDKAGNVANTSLDVNVDLTPPPDPRLVINTIADDNIINATESQAPITVSGVVHHGVNPQTILLDINSIQPAGAITTNGDGEWSITIPVNDPAYGAFTSNGTVNITASTQVNSDTIDTSTTVLVDITPPSVAVLTFAGDNKLDNSELATAQTITGTASVAEAGRFVTVTLETKTYQAQVQSDGTWSVSVPTADLNLLSQGQHFITATLKDAAGNTGTATPLTIVVDTEIPLLTIDAFAGNNILTMSEALLGQVLSGKGEIGATVTLTAGPLTGSVVVDGNGNWQIPFNEIDLTSLTDGPQVIGLTITDAVGNSSSTSVTLNVALNQSLGAGVDDIFGGNGILNYAESLITQVISGHATGSSLGAKVSVTLAGTTLEATVGAGGAWSVSFPPSLLSGLSDGLLQVSVDIVDINGNSKNQLIDIDVLRSVPIIDSVLAFGNNGLNALEAAADQIISGVVGNIDLTKGAFNIEVTLGTKTYTTTVGAGGAWSLSIPTLDLKALQDGTLALGVSVTDYGGNVVSKTVNVPAIINNLPSLTLDPIFGDGLLNLGDLLNNQTISGTALNLVSGTQLTIDLAGVRTLTATVGADGKWSASVGTDALALLQNLGNGNVTVTVSASDSVGNSVSLGGGLTLGFSLPVVTLNPLFGGDGFLNAAEALVAQTLSGVVTNAAVGSQVSVTLGGKTFQTTVGAAGAFSVILQPSDLAALVDGSVSVKVEVTNASGNTGSISQTITSITKNLPTISLNSLFGGDGYLNVAEAALGQTLSGTTTNAAVGSKITVTLGGLTLDTTVGAGGVWSIPVSSTQLQSLVNGNLTIGATVTDSAGNSNSASAGLTVALTPPTITFNPLFGNGILDLNDLLSTQVLSGSSTQAAAGTPLTLTLGGKTYTTTINVGGGWSLNLPTADLQALADGALTVNAQLTNAAGNGVSQNNLVTVAINAAPTITLNPLFGGDGLLNAVEAATNPIISGTTTNAVGSTLRVMLGSRTLTTVVQSDGTWSVGLSTTDLTALTDGTLALGVALTNPAGKNVSVSTNVGIGIHNLPTLSLGSLFGDGYLNLTEAQANQTISGTVSNAVGGSISVNVGGLVLTTPVTANGSWSVTVPTANLINIVDGNLNVGVTVTDRYGNSTSASGAAIVKTHALPQLGIDPTTLLSALSILTNGLTIHGESRNVQTGAQVSVSLFKANSVLNGINLTGTVQADGSWTAKLESSLLTSLGLTVLNILTVLTGTLVSASVTDVAGNSVGVSAGLTTGILLPLTLASLESQSLALEESGVSLETSHTAAALHDTSTTHDDSTLTLASLNEVQSTGASATLTTPSEISYSIGGVAITPTDSNTLTGSDGDDLLQVSVLDALHIDGGAGTDTLALNGEHLALDLTALGLSIDNIEIFDLGASGTNSITLDLARALSVTDKPEDDLLILGATGNEVNLIPDPSGTWALTGQRALDGTMFDVYHNSALESSNTLGDVLVQHGLHVNIV
ncbi:Ig-like domain-containing protein [Candidatus Symbiopectobacterium sp. NZEC135]|uniref:Ig-like domain-containing protein n=1 Tax=Candidatus Symbiopectobacterium sp. NZEC135 TaxID=2820471 RepID=UPI002226ABB1|nr:Ig-like domain-containing protein [Candidatus Symbiopectobacterium sp. NZEC135]MCW2478425.1 Ig-like domain-containing protein [Candidatus Symbiopectobacterium sp. NZEC135]